MRKKKNIIKCFAVVFITAFLTTTIKPFPVKATTNGKTRANAVDWVCARGNENWSVDVDGAYGCQCVDLILAYYDYLLGWHTSGNAKDYSWNNLPDGWARVYSNPQPGDIVVWGAGAQMGWSPLATEYANSTYGHIGIIWQINASGTISTIETNSMGKQYAAYHERYTNNVACYIRPDFSSGNRTDYLNLGDSFNAIIIRSDIWTQIHVDNNTNNVILRSNNAASADDHWHFERQSDGSYIITSLYNGKVLDAYGDGNVSGANVYVYSRYGGNNQRWYLFGNSTAYELAPKSATNLRLDAAGGSTTDGTNIQFSTNKRFSSQKNVSVSWIKNKYTKKGLKSHKKYFIRIRTYKNYTDEKGRLQKAYSVWTTIKKKTK